MSFWPADSNLTALVSSGEPMQTTNNLNVNLSKIYDELSTLHLNNLIYFDDMELKKL